MNSNYEYIFGTRNCGFRLKGKTCLSKKYILLPFLASILILIRESEAMPLRSNTIQSETQSKLRNRSLKNEWKDFKALRDCPDELLDGKNLFRREMAEKTFALIYDWAEDEELLEGSLTEDELEDLLEFDDLPAEVQIEFLEYACLYDEDCDEIEDLPSSKVHIPMGDIGNDAEDIAEDLCTKVALNFDDIFDLVKRAADQIPTPDPSPTPTFQPTLSSSSHPSQNPTIQSSQHPSIFSSESPTSLPTEGEDELVVLSISFGIRVSGSQLVHTELLSIGSLIENEIEKKTTMALEEVAPGRKERQLRKFLRKNTRMLASFVDVKVRSLESVECSPEPPEGVEITCFLVNSDITIDTEGEDSQDVITKVENGVKEGEEEGAFFSYLPGLQSIDTVPANAVEDPNTSNTNTNTNTIRIATIVTCVLGAVLLSILFLRYAGERRKNKKSELYTSYDTEVKEEDLDAKHTDQEEEEEYEDVFTPTANQNVVVLYESNEPPKATHNPTDDHSPTEVPHIKKYPGTLANPCTIGETKTNYESEYASTSVNPSTLGDTKATSTLYTEDTLGEDASVSSTEYDTTMSEQNSKNTWSQYSNSQSKRNTQEDFISESVKNVFDLINACNPLVTDDLNNDYVFRNKGSNSRTKSAKRNSPLKLPSSNEMNEDIELVIKPTGSSQNESLDEKVLSPGSLVKFIPTSTKNAEHVPVSDSSTESGDEIKLLKEKTKSDDKEKPPKSPLAKWKMRRLSKKKASKSPTKSRRKNSFDDEKEKEYKEYEGDSDVSSLGDGSPVKASKQKKKSLWKAALDEKTGDYYYYHTITNATTWKKPASFDDDETNESLEDKTPKVMLQIISTNEDQNDVKFKKNKIAQLLEQLSPDETEANQAIINQYAGREDELIMQLEELVEQAPFDEPSVVSLENMSLTEQQMGHFTPASPSRSTFTSSTHSKSVSGYSNSSSAMRAPGLHGRILTASSAGVLSRHSRLSHATEKVSNINRFKNQSLLPITAFNEESDLSSLDSKDAELQIHTNNMIEELPRVDEIFEQPFAPAHKKRNLKAEVYSGSNYALTSEKYNRSERRPKSTRDKEKRRSSKNGQKILLNRSFEERIGSDVEKYKSEGSTVSELSDPTLLRDGNLDRGRAKVRLRKAIKEKDWVRASSLEASLRSGGDASSYSDMSSRGGRKSKYTKPPIKWTQSDLDQKIAENDWDSVFKYVGVMKKSGSASNIQQFQTKKRFGARSQLQHTNLTVRRTVSGSFSDDDTDEDRFMEYPRRRAV